MGIKFDVRMAVTTYTKVGDDYQSVEATKKFVLHNYDDLQNLLLTLIESSEDAIKFEVRKEEVSD